jgi:hypothetical protein
MRLAVRIAVAVMLWTALSACTATAPSASEAQRPRALVVAEARSDVGNDRPRVSYDGLMVRRRTVLVVHLDRAHDVAGVRGQLKHIAAQHHTTVSPISASVLDPVPLEALAPDLVMALPIDATVADGGRLMGLVLRDGDWRSIVQAYDVLSVLVHDLRFTVSTAHPAELAGALAREGILSDALGSYTTVSRSERLDVLYTGPLLSDRLVRSVQAAIARRAFVAPAAVSIAPRSPAGVGVDMAQEPTPTPLEEPSPSTGHHDH